MILPQGNKAMVERTVLVLTEGGVQLLAPWHRPRLPGLSWSVSPMTAPLYSVDWNIWFYSQDWRDRRENALADRMFWQGRWSPPGQQLICH